MRPALLTSSPQGIPHVRPTIEDPQALTLISLRNIQSPSASPIIPSRPLNALPKSVPESTDWSSQPTRRMGSPGISMATLAPTLRIVSPSPPPAAASPSPPPAAASPHIINLTSPTTASSPSSIT
ncbi:hypothetical protein BH10PSE19_BH10PSE19_19340 [soil metagenome]